jgi:hypothetical protein
MVYVTLGNHTSQARNPPYGKVCIGIINLPDRRSGDKNEDYKLACRMLYQRYWKEIADILLLWEPGVAVQLPGDRPYSILRMRLGLFSGDLLETRMMAATTSTHAVRCCTKVGNKSGDGDASDNGTGPAPARGTGLDSDSDTGGHRRRDAGQPPVAQPAARDSDAEDSDDSVDEAGILDRVPQNTVRDIAVGLQ